MKKFIVTVSIFFTAYSVAAQDMITPLQYIELYKDIAVNEMKRTGVPAAITLAQGLLETENGNSRLVKKSNNHFGIKCKSTWMAASVTHDDDEIGECFRSYKTAIESYRDHSDFLRANQRYSFLFELDVKDYSGWAYGLKKAGYATNPAYPQILIKHIEQYNLQQYTLQGADELPKNFAAGYQNEMAVQNGNAVKINNEDALAEGLTANSDKIITVNGARCVYAAKGTSLLVLATKNNIPLNKLLSFNELSEDGLLINNQYVYLEKKSKTGDKDYYIAKEGESLYSIAQNNGIQLQHMLDYNKLWGNEDILAGTIIYLKPGWLQPKKETPKSILQQPVNTHTVQPKEGLYAIAKKYNITVEQLKEWNKLQSDALSVGQQLTISQ
jgi:LysM repeat protein